jgi:hypothetical protein
VIPSLATISFTNVRHLKSNLVRALHVITRFDEEMILTPSSIRSSSNFMKWLQWKVLQL